MGTASASWGRFPVSRETLEVFRAAGRDKEEMNIQEGEREEGETETSETEKEQIATKTRDGHFTYLGFLTFFLPVLSREPLAFPENIDLKNERRKSDKIDEEKNPKP
ncbi:hypothetical protein NDU88_003319 [Pleurodeles waltl]|uniref:Uncharacterized protein n=1 Tax=Pleurodeles waltl TaxID=8319 RepID=A0AAV7T679_PLEWA|nr:hypothetical protein NDU88_003319 [Pleurodeles waltl]